MKKTQGTRKATVTQKADEASRRLLLSYLLETISDAIYFKDQKSRFTLVSRSLAARFGVPSVDAIIGKTDFDFYTEEHARQAFTDEQRLMRTGNAIVNLEEKETWPDGTTTWVSTTKMPLYDESGVIIGTFGISRDITDRRLAQDELARYKESLEVLVEDRTRALRETNFKLQKEMLERKRAEGALLQSERLEAISSMAGGVAAHFNTIIDVISSYASSIASNFIPGSRVHEDASHILEATRRAGELTRRLMGVAQFREGDKTIFVEPVALGRVVEEAIGLVRDIFQGQNVTIDLADIAGMPFVEADRGQLLDVVMTLLLNAAEAMPEGGTIRVDTAERVLRPRGPDGKPLGRRRAFSMLRVRDSGVGMSRDELEHIFEPFYTTKASASSFGLGLPYAQSAIRAMGGWIMVWSQSSKGSSFRVFLPRARGTRARTKAGGEAGERTVLVVDDDADTLGMMEQTLTAAGYRVLRAVSPSLAVEQINGDAKRIDVCVVDAVMTNGDVPGLIGVIRKQHPAAALLITSGFSRDFVRGMVPTGNWGYLQKPFADGTLIKVVAESAGSGDGR